MIIGIDAVLPIADLHVAGGAEVEPQPQVVQARIAAQVHPRLTPLGVVDYLVDDTRGDGRRLHQSRRAEIAPIAVVGIRVRRNQVPFGAVVGNICAGTVVIVAVLGVAKIREVENRFVLGVVSFQAKRVRGYAAVRSTRHVVTQQRARVGRGAVVPVGRTGLHVAVLVKGIIPIVRAARIGVFQPEVEAVVAQVPITEFTVAGQVVGCRHAVAHVAPTFPSRVPEVVVDRRECHPFDIGQSTAAGAISQSYSFGRIGEDRLEVTLGVECVEVAVTRGGEEQVGKLAVLDVIRSAGHAGEYNRLAVVGNLFDELGPGPAISSANDIIVSRGWIGEREPPAACGRLRVPIVGAVDAVQTSFVGHAKQLIRLARYIDVRQAGKALDTGVNAFIVVPVGIGVCVQDSVGHDVARGTRTRGSCSARILKRGAVSVQHVHQVLIVLPIAPRTAVGHGTRRVAHGVDVPIGAAGFDTVDNRLEFDGVGQRIQACGRVLGIRPIGGDPGGADGGRLPGIARVQKTILSLAGGAVSVPGDAVKQAVVSHGDVVVGQIYPGVRVRQPVRPYPAHVRLELSGERIDRKEIIPRVDVHYHVAQVELVGDRLEPLPHVVRHIVVAVVGTPVRVVDDRGARGILTRDVFADHAIDRVDRLSASLRLSVVQRRRRAQNGRNGHVIGAIVAFL